MQYLITKEQIDAQVKHLHRYHIDNSASGQLAIDAAIAMLQSLPVLEGEPVARQYFTKFKYGSGWTETPEYNAEILDTRDLYTHPAPFTPITADDVTDGMIHDWHANTFGTQSMGVTDRDMIAAAVNAWGAKK